MLTKTNELHPDLLSIAALNFLPGNTSASRVQMFTSHLGQRLVIDGATERRIQTGMEEEFGKYTFKIEMPVDAMVIRVIDRYRKTNDITNIKISPHVMVIYENINTKEIGCLEIANHNSHHQYFGYRHKPGPGMNMLYPGNIIPKGTVFMDSPCVTPEGGYMYGAEVNVAFMSHPAVSEDGILIRRGALDKFKFRTYETRVVEFGSKYFPLNVYGKPENFKAFPDIGEYVSETGILMALRSRDAELCVSEQSMYSVCDIDHIFDRVIYAPAGGKIVDIQVQHDRGQYSPTPIGMDEHLDKYVESTLTYYTEILDEINKLSRKRGPNALISREVHRLCVEAHAAIAGADPAQKITKIYRKTPVDDYRIVFTIESEIVPNIGFKLTGCVGDKGVICQIVEDADMPVDDDGNVADIVADPYSTISRMNIPRKYEQYLNAAARDIRKNVMLRLNIEKTQKYPDIKVDELYLTNKAEVLACFDYINGFYSICTPRTYEAMNALDDEGKLSHVKYVVKEGIYLYMPTDNEPIIQEMLAAVKKHYDPIYGPVTYVGNSGRKVRTKSNVRIGSVYMMLLEKTGDDWGAVSSAKFQHFGIPSKLTKSDKYTAPARHQPVRGIGETEGRLLASYVGALGTAEIIDRNNSPTTHKFIVESIINAAKPTNIDVSVNRYLHPLGGAKPLQLIKHIAYCAGWAFTYKSTKNDEVVQYHGFNVKS